MRASAARASAARTLREYAAAAALVAGVAMQIADLLDGGLLNGGACQCERCRRARGRTEDGRAS